MALAATLLFYFQLTKSGAGVTGKSGSITATIKKLTRGSTPTITTVTTGGAVTVGSVAEVDSSNAKGLYVVGVSGLDPAADYIAGAHYTGTASDVDLVDVPALWSEFSPSINAGAIPQITAGLTGGLPLSVDDTSGVLLAASQAAINFAELHVAGPFTFDSLYCASIFQIDGQLLAAYLTVTNDFSVNGNVQGAGGGLALVGSRVDLVDAPNATAITAINAAILIAINNLNNLSALANIYGSPLLEIPDSSSTDFAFTVVIRDSEGKLVDLDASPTIAAANAAGTSRSANLSAVSHPATGRYTFTYSVASTAAEEGLRITISGAVSAEGRYIEWIGAVVNYDTITTLLAVKAKTDLIATNAADSPNAVTAQGNAATAATQSTAAATSAATAATQSTNAATDAAAVKTLAQGTSGFAAIKTAVDGITTGSGNIVFTGANAVTITVTDDATPTPNVIPGAKVRITLASQSQLQETNGSGIAQTSTNVLPALDDGTYSYAVTAGMEYEGATGTIVVDATHKTFTIVLPASAITPPVEPDGCTVSFLAIHAGSPLANTAFRFTCTTAPTGDGTVFVNETRTVTSGSTGLVEIELPQSSTWKGRATTGAAFDITVPAASTYQPPNVSV